MRLAFCGNLSNGYYASVFEGVKSWLAENPQARLLDWNGSHQIPPKALPYLRPEGILLGPHKLAELPEAGWAVPIVGYTNRPDAEGLPLVVNDDREVGRMAARALLEAGYGRFFAIESSHPTALLRLSGFEEVARAGGRTVNRHCVDLRRPRAGEGFADALAEQERAYRTFVGGLKADTGIFCPLIAQVPHLRGMIEEAGTLSLPGELGVLVGDLPDAGMADSGLAHVRLNGSEIGRRACALLQEMLESGQKPTARRIEIAPQGVEWGRTLRPRAGSSLVEAMTAYFLPRLAEPVGMAEVARHLGLSRRTLELKLHSLGQPSPHEHLTALRLRKGEALLRETDLSIEQVAERCGFADPRSFTRRFRERYGCPPARFRRQMCG
ncbi:MAG: helix-turn-helix domain-containing protein [Opitutales bacterium]|nr:helix-turn-helix domain-containing protein [Opitutales bacterium]